MVALTPTATADKIGGTFGAKDVTVFSVRLPVFVKASMYHIFLSKEDKKQDHWAEGECNYLTLHHLL